MLQVSGPNSGVEAESMRRPVETKPGDTNNGSQHRPSSDVTSPSWRFQPQSATDALSRRLDLGKQEDRQQGWHDSESDVRQLIQQIEPRTPRSHGGIERGGLLVHRHTSSEALDHPQN